METTELNQLVTGSKMIQILGISSATFYAWIKKGYIPFYKVGNNKKYNPHEVIKALLSRKVNASAI